MTFPEALAVQNESGIRKSEPVHAPPGGGQETLDPMGQTQGSRAPSGSSPRQAKWFGSGLGEQALFSYCEGRMVQGGHPNRPD